ncbi:MAG: 8-amino-7-oxononanoate synthase [Planctomycetota bacterium]
MIRCFHVLFSARSLPYDLTQHPVSLTAVNVVQLRGEVSRLSRPSKGTDPSKWADFSSQLDELRKLERFRSLVPSTFQGIRLTDPGGRTLINFGSNDYLGLAADPTDPEHRLEKQSHRVGSGASALVCGWTDRHERLASELARFEEAERVVVFPSGFAACSGVVATLARAGDLIVSDQLNHASLIDGCRLSKAETVIYPHRDVEAVRAVLAARRHQYRRVWIVTDTVFGMDGDLAPLNELCDVAEEFEGEVIADEAHATGVLGEHGSGACEALSLKSKIAIRIGTLSKALASQGGFVACPSVIGEFLVNRCRSLIYSTSLALPSVEQAIAMIADTDLLARRRDRVCRLAAALRRDLGITAPPIESQIPIVPVLIGEDHAAVAASKQLREQGLFVPAIRPPTVPEGLARLRISLSAAHTDAMISHLVEGLRSI